MPVHEIAATYEFQCDGCGVIATQPSKSRPKYWCNLTVAQDAYDYQGAAVADGTIHRLLCGDCRALVIEAINSTVKERAALLAALEPAEEGR